MSNLSINVNGNSLIKSFNDALKEEEFKKLVHNLKIKPEIAQKYTSKLQDTVEELKRCKNCKGLYMCKNNVEGHVLFPNLNDDKIIFTYK